MPQVKILAKSGLSFRFIGIQSLGDGLFFQSVPATPCKSSQNQISISRGVNQNCLSQDNQLLISAVISFGVSIL